MKSSSGRGLSLWAVSLPALPLRGETDKPSPSRLNFYSGIHPSLDFQWLGCCHCVSNGNGAVKSWKKNQKIRRILFKWDLPRLKLNEKCSAKLKHGQSLSIPIQGVDKMGKKKLDIFKEKERRKTWITCFQLETWLQTPHRNAGAVEVEEEPPPERRPAGAGGGKRALPASPMAIWPPLVRPVDETDRAGLLLLVPTPGW